MQSNKSRVLTNAQIVSKARIVDPTDLPPTTEAALIRIVFGLKRYAGQPAQCVMWPCGLMGMIPADPSEGPIWEAALIQSYRAGHQDGCATGVC